MPKTAIIGAARTPFGKLGGGLSPLDATDLGGKAIEAALERAEVKGEEVQHVVFGQVLQAGQGQIPSRQAQIKGGIPKEVSSETVNKVCASGLRSAGIVDQAVRAGDLDVAVAGGMESMSAAPYLLKQARFGFRMGDAKALDGMVHDGLTNPFTGKHMGEEADEVGEELEITRADMDKFALRSHELAIQATDEGRLPEEITPVTISSKKGDTTVEVDEAPRRESSLESLSKLRGAFHKDGAHTAGNAPGVNDGAGALVLSSDEWAKANGRAALATIVAQAAVADARAGRAVGRRHRPVRDQRGLCLGGAQLDAHARRGRVQGERERRRDRTRSPDRGERRPHPDDARARAAEARRRPRLRGDLLRRRPGRRHDRRGERQLVELGVHGCRH
jgi:acetyl-CoA C-acetyltransferase